MTKAVDFYFTPISPWTYLGTPTLRAAAARTGATVRFKPVDIMQLFATANVKPVGQRPEPIRKYRLVDLKRWSEHRALASNLHPKHFPTSPLLACRMIVAASRSGADVADLSEAYMRACWSEERDVADERTAVEIADACGLDGTALRGQADSPEVESQFQANTQEALGQGVWGSPSYVVDGELFWGQDRLELLERKLAG